MSDEQWGELMDLAITAVMNERYWYVVGATGQFWLMFTLVSVFAWIGSIAATIYAIVADKRLFAVPVVWTAITCGIFHFVDTPFVGPLAVPQSLEQSWSALKRDIDLALVENDPSQIQEFRRRKVELNAGEPQPPSLSLLKRCLAEEEKARAFR